MTASKREPDSGAEVVRGEERASESIADTEKKGFRNLGSLERRGSGNGRNHWGRKREKQRSNEMIT